MKKKKAPRRVVADEALFVPRECELDGLLANAGHVAACISGCPWMGKKVAQRQLLLPRSFAATQSMKATRSRNWR